MLRQLLLGAAGCIDSPTIIVWGSKGGINEAFATVNKNDGD